MESLLRDARLLTVLGPGGIGKTALALELARRCADVFVDGVWLVDLTPCRNEAEVGDQLLTTFGLARHGGEWEQRLIAALQPLLVATVAGRLLGDPTTRRMWAGMALGLDPHARGGAVGGDGEQIDPVRPVVERLGPRAGARLRADA